MDNSTNIVKAIGSAAQIIADEYVAEIGRLESELIVERERVKELKNALYECREYVNEYAVQKSANYMHYGKEMDLLRKIDDLTAPQQPEKTESDPNKPIYNHGENCKSLFSACPKCLEAFDNRNKQPEKTED